MTPHHAQIIHDIHQGREEFLKTPEGAKMLKTSRKAEEEDQEENGEVGGLELQEATDVESETVDEEKGAENYKRRKTLFDLIVMQSNFEQKQYLIFASLHLYNFATLPKGQFSQEGITKCRILFCPRGDLTMEQTAWPKAAMAENLRKPLYQ